MKLSNEAVNLAKSILSSVFKDRDNEDITKIASMIEEVFGNSNNMKLRRKVKDQKLSLKTLHRAHIVLKHNSQKYYASEQYKSDVEEKKVIPMSQRLSK